VGESDTEQVSLGVCRFLPAKHRSINDVHPLLRWSHYFITISDVIWDWTCDPSLGQILFSLL